MKISRLSISLVVLSLFAMTAAPAFSRGTSRWVSLDTLHVKDRVERDVLHLEGKKGSFDAIRLKVLGSAVQFRSVEIHFENGAVQEVALRSVIRAGGTSRVIDLEGGHRALEKIVFVYDAQTVRPGKGARVRVDGRR